MHFNVLILNRLKYFFVNKYVRSYRIFTTSPPLPLLIWPLYPLFYCINAIIYFVGASSILFLMAFKVHLYKSFTFNLWKLFFRLHSMWHVFLTWAVSANLKLHWYFNSKFYALTKLNLFEQVNFFRVIGPSQKFNLSMKN